MNRRNFLLLLGSLLMLIWMLSFGESTFNLISRIINDEPYYFDNTFLYFLAFALVPFVLNSYMDGVNLDGEMSRKRKMWQQVNFLLLSFFALMLVFLSIATYFAFFDTFLDEKISIQMFILLIPISFTLMSLALTRYLYISSMRK